VGKDSGGRPGDHSFEEVAEPKEKKKKSAELTRPWGTKGMLQERKSSDDATRIQGPRRSKGIRHFLPAQGRQRNTLSKPSDPYEKKGRRKSALSRRRDLPTDSPLNHSQPDLQWGYYGRPHVERDRNLGEGKEPTRCPQDGARGRCSDEREG